MSSFFWKYKKHLRFIFAFWTKTLYNKEQNNLHIIYTMFSHPHRKLLAKDIPSIWAGAGAVIILIIAEFLILDIELVRGNLWDVYLGFEIGLHALLSILFGFFVALQVYKIRLFTPQEIKPARTLWGTIGGFLWVLVVGCPACSITLAWLLGLWAVLVSLPLGWLEVKILSIIILAIVAYIMFRDLTICKKSRKK